MSFSCSLRILLVPALAGVMAAATEPARALDLGVQLGGVGVGVQLGGSSPVGVDADIDLNQDGDGLHVGIGTSGVEVGVEAGSDGATGSNAPERLEQEGALEAVQEHRALPLGDILAKARASTDGEIIDAQLISVRNILLYQLKVLGKGGDVSQLYFYARSGLPVRAN